MLVPSPEVMSPEHRLHVRASSRLLGSSSKMSVLGRHWKRSYGYRVRVSCLVADSLSSIGESVLQLEEVYKLNSSTCDSRCADDYSRLYE